MERITRAKENGFKAIEFWNWKKRDIDSINRKCKENNINIGTINGLTPNSNFQIINPDDTENCIKDLKKAIKKAKRLNCNNITILSNAIDKEGKCTPLSNLSQREKRKNVLSVLEQIAPFAEQEKINILLETLNEFDFPGYFFNHVDDTFKIIREIRHRSISVLFDIYHIQVSDGNIISRLEKNIDLISYIHVADVPGRNEPGTGELNYRNIYKKLLEIGYDSYVGFEYWPLKSTEDSLVSIKEIFQF